MTTLPTGHICCNKQCYTNQPNFCGHDIKYIFFIFKSINVSDIRKVQRSNHQSNVNIGHRLENTSIVLSFTNDISYFIWSIIILVYLCNSHIAAITLLNRLRTSKERLNVLMLKQNCRNRLGRGLRVKLCFKYDEAAKVEKMWILYFQGICSRSKTLINYYVVIPPAYLWQKWLINYKKLCEYLKE